MKHEETISGKTRGIPFPGSQHPISWCMPEVTLARLLALLAAEATAVAAELAERILCGMDEELGKMPQTALELAAYREAKPL